MKTRIIFLLTLISCIVHAQENGGWTKPQINYDSLTTAFKERYKKPAKYCTSYSAFRNNQWIETEEIILQDFEDKKNIIDQCDQFRFKADSKELEKTLKNKALVVLFGDSLYFNCKRGTNNTSNQMNTTLSAYALNFGLIGGLLAGAMMGAFYDHDCVLYMNEENELLKKIDAKMMESLLSDNSEELEEYKSLKRKQKNSAIVDTSQLTNERMQFRHTGDE